MKKGILLVLVLILFATVSGCEKEEDPVASDLREYIQSMESVFIMEDSVNTSFNSVSGDNYTDSETTYNVIMNETLPKMNNVRNAAGNIKPSTPTVRNLHREYEQFLDDKYLSILTFSNGISSSDTDKLHAAVESLIKANQKKQDYFDALEDLTYELFQD